MVAKDSVAVFEGTNVEADVVAALLEAAGLHPILQARESVTTFAGLDNAKVYVPAEEADQARQAISEAKAAGSEDAG